MTSKKKNQKQKKVETNTEWLDKVINQLTNKDFGNQAFPNYEIKKI